MHMVRDDMWRDGLILEMRGIIWVEAKAPTCRPDRSELASRSIRESRPLFLSVTMVIYVRNDQYRSIKVENNKQADNGIVILVFDALDL
jgi:hypothetical protein